MCPGLLSASAPRPLAPEPSSLSSLFSLLPSLHHRPPPSPRRATTLPAPSILRSGGATTLPKDWARVLAPPIGGGSRGEARLVMASPPSAPAVNAVLVAAPPSLAVALARRVPATPALRAVGGKARRWWRRRRWTTCARPWTSTPRASCPGSGPRTSPSSATPTPTSSPRSSPLTRSVCPHPPITISFSFLGQCYTASSYYCLLQNILNFREELNVVNRELPIPDISAKKLSVETI
uniref:Uncharacterized protein n=1 Tax=Arundo donax TaxID=35708 RepID=A0A0A9HRY1_ARUDO